MISSIDILSCSGSFLSEERRGGVEVVGMGRGGGMCVLGGGGGRQRQRRFREVAGRAT